MAPFISWKAPQVSWYVTKIFGTLKIKSSEFCVVFCRRTVTTGDFRNWLGVKLARSDTYKTKQFIRDVDGPPKKCLKFEILHDQ